MSYLPDAGETRTFLAAAIFTASYLVFAIGKFPGLKVDRPGAAIIGAVAMVASGVVAPREVVGLVDFYLLAVATASNIGSVATITGNPQNILVGSYSGLSYSEFLRHLGPVALAGLLLDWAILRVLLPRPAFLPPPPRRLELPRPDLSRVAKPVVVAAAVVVGFFVGAPPAMVAALGAAALLLSRTLEPKLLHEQVDWSLLVFFVGLFLVVGGADKAGITGRLLDVALRFNVHRPAVFTAVVAVLSNVVSNVPAVMLLKSLVPGFADPRTAWLLLAMASTLAGNLTITGSVANLIVVEGARGEGVHIGFRDYLKVGVPVTLATLLVGWARLALLP